MKTKNSFLIRISREGTTLAMAAIVGLLAFAPQALPGASVSELFEQGVYTEETKGDLDAAMRLYRQVVAEAKADESIAAQAQYRLGVCHYKQQKYAEATAAFEKLVKAYPDQKEMVRLANEYLAGAVAWLPAPWTNGEQMRLDLKSNTGFELGYARYTVQSGTLDGRKIWRFSSRLAVGVQQASQVEVDADSMKPIHCRWRHTILGEADATYSPGRVEVRLKGKDEAKTIELNSVCYDNEEVLQLIRRLPLALNYRTTLHIFSPLNPSSSIAIQLKVAGEEKVKVPAGTFECYKVELSLVNQTFWYSVDEHRYLVKFDAGAVTAELAGVEHLTAAQLAEQNAAAFDFRIGKAGGGIPTIQEQNAQPLQNQAKLLILTAARLGRVPEASHWCEDLNASGARYPSVPTNTVFALNAQVAGYELTNLPADTVVFFETTNHGWNQVGGPEILAKNPSGVAVAFADGRALLVDPSESARLRWAP